MRNYIRAYSTHVHVHYHLDVPDPDPDIDEDFELTFFGQTEQMANDTASQALAAIISTDPDHYSGFTFENPRLNVLLNQALVSALLINPTAGDSLTGGAIGQSIFDNQVSICQQQGIDPFISPKEQDVYPWNGRARRHLR